MHRVGRLTSQYRDGVGVRVEGDRRLGRVRSPYSTKHHAARLSVLATTPTPAQGAQTAIYLASSPDMAGVTGQFFANRKPKTANKLAYDTDMMGRLWRVSADLVGMTPGPHLSTGATA